MSLTASQQSAIAAEGNVLVVAGAGTGKTHTLVERCLARVCAPENPISLENVLMVTFTEAAAAEMRKRLREELERRAAAAPDNQWLAQQLALVDTALISTLHSFCLRLVREHFHELDLDPQLTVLAEEQSLLLARESLDKLMEKHYAGGTPVATAVQQLVLDHGRGWDQPIRHLVLRLHHYTQTLRDPAAWFAEQSAPLAETQPTRWRQWFADGLAEWRTLWQPALLAQPMENTVAHRCARLLKDPPSTGDMFAQIIELGTDPHWPRGTKGKFRDPIEKLFEEAEFLHSLLPTPDGRDPLSEDWDWVRPHMTALLNLAREFTAELARAKRELAAVDFHDLEQFALRLLVDRATPGPTPVAQHWRERLRLVFVDEYQDINAAQDAILRALGGEAAAANRFLVGDVKQSIYRFRLADPAIFQNYKSEWEFNADPLAAAAQKETPPPRPGQTIPLSDNFRSHEHILNFVNSLFAVLMRAEVGGVQYDQPQHLRFGAPTERQALAAGADGPPRVELHVVLTGREEHQESDADADLTGVEREARLVAARLIQLQQEHFQVWDKNEKQFRPVVWRDMAILLRSPRYKAETYAKVFAQFNVALLVARGGFFNSQEVMDLLNLLQTLDNPLQDLPLLAVLRSPLVGLTLDELATIRLTQVKAPFWTALAHFSTIKKTAAQATLRRKLDQFLERFHRWRQLARQAALSQCVEAALDETHYEAWLLAQPRGEQKRANAQRLLALTRQFDQFQRQGLFRFLKFIEAQLDAESDLEPAAAAGSDAVQLISIHQSKGLDFPVVVVGDLGKRFNFDDLKGRVILDEQYGLCPKVKPPNTGGVYPSLPYWLAQRRQHRELLGEELRLLYVATTRARDLLILAGTTSRNALEKWAAGEANPLSVAEILSAKSFLGWLGPGISRMSGITDWPATGRNLLLTWTLCEESDERLQLQLELPATANPEAVAPAINPAELSALRSKLGWRYAHEAATLEPAKTSVSALRRRLRDETDDEARPLFPAAAFKVPVRRRTADSPLTAAEIGTAHHLFLQMVDLSRLDTLHDLRNEAERLRAATILTDAQAGALNFASLQAFWGSPLGQRIRARPAIEVYRESSFTARLSRSDLEAAHLAVSDDLPESEFMVAQGAIDLAVVQPKEIWIVDFKTDDINEQELTARAEIYAPQLQLYALALMRTYRRPVTECWLYFLSLQKSVAVGLTRIHPRAKR